MSAYPPHLSHIDDAIQRLRGSGGLADMFSGEKALAAVPWPRAARLPDGHLFNRRAVAEEFERRLPAIALLDPAALWASQPSVTRAGVEYYLSPDWFCSGITYADRNSEFNRLPVVEVRPDGIYAILNGHHRSCAALLQGRLVLARVVVSVRATVHSERVDLRLPSLAVGTWSTAVRADSVSSAVTAIMSGQAVTVESEALANSIVDALQTPVEH